MLFACTPGVFLNLYNATNETLTITRVQFRPVITIPAQTATGSSLGYQTGERVLIRGSHHE